MRSYTTHAGRRPAPRRNSPLARAIEQLESRVLLSSTIADWTFETNLPATPPAGTSAGPFSPEIGVATDQATQVHAASSTYSNAAGNGSKSSLSANTWAVGDYDQFLINTGTAMENVTGISFDQTSSNTGPQNFQLEYST